VSKLLINEPPLQVLPTLAKSIGLNEAIVLQQLHYHSLRSKDDGWVQRALSKWAADEFKFWSYDTFQRAVRKLSDAGLIEIETVGVAGGQGGTRREARIRVNHTNLEALELQIVRSPQSADTSTPQSAVTSDRNLHGPRTDLKERDLKRTPLSPPKGGRGRAAGRKRNKPAALAAVVEPCPNGTTDAAAVAAWQAASDQLEAKIASETFETWLDPIHAHRFAEDGALIIAAPWEITGWLTEKYGSVIADAIGRPARIVACSGAHS
jgi:hypothetical protein